MALWLSLPNFRVSAGIRRTHGRRRGVDVFHRIALLRLESDHMLFFRRFFLSVSWVAQSIAAAIFPGLRRKMDARAVPMRKGGFYRCRDLSSQARG